MRAHSSYLGQFFTAKRGGVNNSSVVFPYRDAAPPFPKPDNAVALQLVRPVKLCCTAIVHQMGLARKQPRRTRVRSVNDFFFPLHPDDTRYGRYTKRTVVFSNAPSTGHKTGSRFLHVVFRLHARIGSFETTAVGPPVSFRRVIGHWIQSVRLARFSTISSGTCRIPDRSGSHFVFITYYRVS